MAIYLLTVTKCGQSLRDGADTMIVHAASETQAKEIAQAKFDGDGNTWTGATVAELATTADWEGWTFDINIYTATPKRFQYVGTSTNDTIDEVAAQLVTLLNADADIAQAAYNTTSQTLTVAGPADLLGGKEVTMTFTPPSGKAFIPSLVGTITDGGASSSALTIVLPADALVPPQVLSWAKSV